MPNLAIGTTLEELEEDEGHEEGYDDGDERIIFLMRFIFGSIVSKRLDFDECFFSFFL